MSEQLEQKSLSQITTAGNMLSKYFLKHSWIPKDYDLILYHGYWTHSRVLGIDRMGVFQFGPVRQWECGGRLLKKQTRKSLFLF